MPPPPAARAKVLHAFAEILVTQGERAATLDAVADRASVSKGGLLYHFPSKDELTEGLADFFGDLVAADTDRMRNAEAGPVDYIVRTSARADSEFELYYAAIAILARGAHQSAALALVRAQDAWRETLAGAVPDALVARALIYICDGLAADAEVRRAASVDPLADSEVERLVELAQELATRGR
ncbi:TetR/AcrR family transcriptional regulator [Ruania alkalisoli]|uniref:TetR/AcrR family transcriptional regulator n=1 Tax=Ruania alkalisoli TaxID=2779775 RepID=A0A7M1SVV5_9MICO|nr:TetR/AcrR family transcriptional regulator [Ruania alkalisoli]QOR71699.1 TetR/AcrR family transcriptional regulator [Ruania alkalisoli]